MPYKDPEKRKQKQAEYSRTYYAKNQAVVRERAKLSKKQRQADWQEYKATLVCERCGFGHPAALDFHHPPGTKEQDLSTFVRSAGKRRVLEELAKCVVLCSNCHRIHHAEERKEKRRLRRKKKKKGGHP